MKKINFILGLAVIAFMMPIEALAMDNPKDGYIEEFPVPGNDDTVIIDNYGTVNYAKTGGSISYNYHLINNLEGATVGENKSTGLIDQFMGGRVENNYGTINKISNTASIGTNTLDGVIKENFNNVDKNLGTIENQYTGTIKENYGNVGIIGAAAKIEKLYEGTITENSGEVVIYPAPEGILTVVKLGTNKGAVRIEADNDNKSSVVIDKIEAGASLQVCAGADCTVVDNAGKIEIAEGGKCNITGTNTGEVIGDNTTPGEEYNYQLILDNVAPSDITFVDFFKKDDDNIYVMGGGQNHNVIVTYDKNKYFYPDTFEINGVIGIRIENSDYSVLDDVNKTFTIHFHTMGEFVHSSDEKHMRKCSGNWNGSECTATFNEESCSLSPATCTDKAKCEKCGAEYGDVLPHSYSWIWENGKHKQVCTQCSDTTNIGTCSYGDWIIDSEAKVGVSGKKHRVCSVCNGVENATIPAKPDNGNKKSNNEQGGNKQNSPSDNPSSSGTEQGNTSENIAAKDIDPTKQATVQTIDPTKQATVQTIDPTKAYTEQVKNSTKQNKSQVKKSIQKSKSNTNPGVGTNNNSDGRDEAAVALDSMNIDTNTGEDSDSEEIFDSEGIPDSETAVDDTESTGQETDVTATGENNGTVSSSNKSKIGKIAGICGFATVVAAAACLFVFLRRKRDN